MPVETLTPAEQAIADAQSARDSFFSQASDLYEAQATARVADVARAPNKAEPAAEPAPPKAPAAPAAAPPAAKAPSKIPGPPSTHAAPVKAPDGEPAGAPSQQAATLEEEVPPADAFDKGPNRPRTEQWRRLHAAKDTISKQLDAARKEVETLKAQVGGAGRQDGVPSPELQKQLQAIQSERDALLQKLEAVAVEKSPRFEAMFKPREEAALNQAKQAVGPDKAERIASLLRQPESVWRDEQINAIIEEIGQNPLRAQKLYGAVAAIDQITSEKAALSQRGSEVFKQMQNEQAAHERRQQEERQRAVETAFNEVASEWKDAGIDEDGLAIAKDVFMGNRDLRDIANASMWVAYGPKAAAQLLQLQKEHEATKAELAKLRGLQPGNASDAGSRLPSADDGPPPGTSYADAVVQAALKAGLPLR